MCLHMPAWAPLSPQLHDTDAVEYKYIAGFAKPDGMRYVELISEMRKGPKQLSWSMRDLLLCTSSRGALTTSGVKGPVDDVGHLFARVVRVDVGHEIVQNGDQSFTVSAGNFRQLSTVMTRLRPSGSG